MNDRQATLAGHEIVPQSLDNGGWQFLISYGPDNEPGGELDKLLSRSFAAKSVLPLVLADGETFDVFVYSYTPRRLYPTVGLKNEHGLSVELQRAG